MTKYNVKKYYKLSKPKLSFKYGECAQTSVFNIWKMIGLCGQYSTIFPYNAISLRQLNLWVTCVNGLKKWSLEFFYLPKSLVYLLIKDWKFNP
jgi:hypothetical protein